jgi:hypothetical protein
MDFLERVEVFKLEKGSKMFDLNKSFNIVVIGQIRNNFSAELHEQFSILADYPYHLCLEVNYKDLDKVDRLQLSAV